MCHQQKLKEHCCGTTNLRVTISCVYKCMRISAIWFNIYSSNKVTGKLLWWCTACMDRLIQIYTGHKCLKVGISPSTLTLSKASNQRNMWKISNNTDWTDTSSKTGFLSHGLFKEKGYTFKGGRSVKNVFASLVDKRSDLQGKICSLETSFPKELNL